MQLRALKRFSARRPGDVFEANERMGKLLKKLGRAVDHVEPVAPPVAPADPVPEPERRGPGRPRKEEETTPVAEVTPARTSIYRRRDMTAEE